MSFTTSNGYVYVWTDGACADNGRQQATAGIGVFFSDGNPWNVSEPAIGRATNQNAEIQAAARACEQAYQARIDYLKIHTDSEFVINCMTKWIHNWMNNGWRTADGSPVTNRKELEHLYNAVRKLRGVDWKYVSAHAGNYENDRADALAKAGAKKYRAYN